MRGPWLSLLWILRAKKLLALSGCIQTLRHETAEYAILLRSELKGKGLGWALMQLLIEYARAEGLKSLYGEVLNENTTMLAMCRELGFKVTGDPKERCMSVVSFELEAAVGKLPAQGTD